ncbi:uncharacterized protein LOC133033131 [Cannabis sativa]|uniref:uncharacterized protein LOC133033131 n=1 Tax=Cannabis sativa TaxID=3483 RepID=UPI0029C9EA59|nr:uncharacterized protein LOC133033131 [Cannabis sativa]
MEQLFLYCYFAYHLWRSSPWGVILIFEFGARVWNLVIFLWNLNLKGVDTDKLFLYASIVLDTIWKTRNENVHNNSLSNIKHSIDSISFCYTDFAACMFAPALAAVSPVWSPPPEDWIKINCDVKVGSGSMCVAALASDHTWIVLWVAANILDFADPLIGEAMTCRLALESVLLKKHLFVLIESDLEKVINALKGTYSSWTIDNYIFICNQLSNRFLSCNFSFIFKCCNFAAHNVARWAFAQNILGMVEISSILDYIFRNDREV